MIRLAVRSIMVEAARFCVRNFRRLVLLASFPAAVYLTLDIMLDAVFTEERISEMPGAAEAYSLLSAVATMVLVPFLVAWHRLTLIGVADVSGRVLPRVGRREGHYACYMFLLGLLLWPGEFLVEFLVPSSGSAYSLWDTLVNLVLICVVLMFQIWLCFRFSFLFVDIAVDGQATVRSAWNMTQGNAYSLALIVIPVIFGIFVVFAGVAAIVVTPILEFAEFEGAWEDMTLIVAGVFATATGGAYAVSAISIAYRDVTGWSPAQPATA